MVVTTVPVVEVFVLHSRLGWFALSTPYLVIKSIDGRNPLAVTTEAAAAAAQSELSGNARYVLIAYVALEPGTIFCLQSGRRDYVQMLLCTRTK